MEFIICLFSAISAYSLYLYICLKLSPLETLQKLLINFTQNYYRPHYNYFSVPNICSINIHLFIYIFILLFVLGLCLMQLSRVKSSDSQYKITGSQGLAVAVIAFAFLLVFQTICQIQYFTKTINKFQNRNLEQKLNVIYNIDSFKFVQYCHKHLSGKYKGQLITDSDYRKTIDPYLIMYYLYPVVDFRQEKDFKKCLVVFNKKDPLSVIPNSYDIIAVYNSKSLLAVQKE